MTCDKIRAFAIGVVLATGFVSAALLHIAISVESGQGFGPGMSHAYAHLLVLPLLCSGAFGVFALALLRSLRACTRAGRRALFRAAARDITRRPFLVPALLTAAAALVVFCAAEQLEQMISLGHVLGPVSFGTDLSASLFIQLALVSALVTASVRALLAVTILAASLVTALLARYLAVPRLRRFSHRSAVPPCTAIALHALARSTGRRGPPQLRFV